jgi:lipid II:glycine glycyltransferase (peptidoglycan interpeptide bridge formation enzyme)
MIAVRCYQEHGRGSSSDVGMRNQKCGNIRLCKSGEDYIAWDRFLYHFAGAHYFQTYGWLKSYEPMGFAPHLLVYELDGAIAGGVAFLSAKVPLLPFHIFVIPHGPLPSDPNTSSWLPLMQRLDQICQEGNAIYAQLYPHEFSDQFVLLPRLEQMGFTSPALFTAHKFSTVPVTVDLVGRTEEDVLKSLRNRTRDYVRHSLKSDLVLRTEIDSLIFDKIYELFQRHGESRGFRPRPYASLRDAWEWFSQNGWATFIQAWHGDTLVGANFVIFMGRTAYYVHGAIDRRFAAQRPAEFIHWQAIRKAIQLQLDKYDLVNFGPPGVAQFKRGFRPQYQSWHDPRAKIYRPTIAKILGAADRYLRPVLRELAKRRADQSPTTIHSNVHS